jgi:hypothetical protein
MTIKSFLPVFPGFYSTLFEYNNEEFDLENIEEDTGKSYTWDEVNFDYAEYHNRVAEACVEAIEHELKTSGFDISLKMEKLVSPQFYNYTNDSIDVEYKMEEHTYYKLIQFAKDHLDEWETYLEDRYTSRPGFYSHYSTDSIDWFEVYLDPESSKIEHTFGSLLEFFFEVQGFRDIDLHYAVDHETGYISYELPED